MYFQPIINTCFVIFSISIVNLIQINCQNSAPGIYAGILTDNSPKCVESLKQLDANSKSVLLMDGKRILPKNEPLRDQFCGPLKQLSRQAGVYLKCTTPFIGQTATILINGLKKPIKHICKASIDSIKKHYICMDDEYIDKLLTIEAQFLDSLTALNSVNGVPRDMVVPGLCCTTNRMLDSIKAIVHKKCPDPTAKPNEFLHARVHESIRDVVDLVCGPYPTTKACFEKVPQIFQTFKSFEKGPRDLRNETFVIKLLQVLLSLSE
ncbi:uncharacterized protein LOC107360228 [Tetranychus urticae]|uniref:Uncharacterized protein n=1 Tax=Tetranychus urticae TaxID=32264 RepID=T1K654_TETUR|nr:uncharacterized protein LOC107360228 [Tetranychus urticae]